MADLLQPPDLTQFTAFTRGDEHALARIYRTQYDALVEHARAALGPDLAHYGGRVAQQAMLDTWEQRDRFADVQGMTAGLEQAIREEAGVQRRKHAALHHGQTASAHASHVVTPTAEMAVAQLLAELHATPVSHEQLAAESQLARKQHAAQHVQSVAKSSGWKVPLALIVVAAVVIVGLMRWVGASSAEVAATKALQADGARSLTSARGQRGTTTLNDGSSARIGSDSRLRLPADFGGAVRTLELNGTAAFTVATGQALPFVVRAGNAIITATGTKFVVRAFDDDSAVYVNVIEGSVSLRVKDKRGDAAVTAGQSMRVALDGTQMALTPSANDRMFGWMRDSLIFVDAPVREILPEINRWFDSKATLADASLGSRVIDLRVGLASSGEALKALANSATLAIGFDDKDHVVLSDQPAAPTNPKGAAKKK